MFQLSFPFCTRKYLLRLISLKCMFSTTEMDTFLLLLMPMPMPMPPLVLLLRLLLFIQFFFRAKVLISLTTTATVARFFRATLPFYRS